MEINGDFSLRFFLNILNSENEDVISFKVLSARTDCMVNNFLLTTKHTPEAGVMPVRLLFLIGKRVTLEIFFFFS